MTSPGGARSPTSLDLLFGPEGDGPETLAREILSVGGDQALGLGNLPAATRAAAVREAATVAAGLLEMDLIGVLVAGWREHRDIVSAARRTLATPGSTELVSLVTHQVTVAQHPSVSVLVDGHRVASLQLDLSVVFDVRALLAGISGGRLVTVHSGRCDVTVTLAVQGTDLVTRRAHLQLPGVVTAGQGIRLLPADEYLAGARPAGTQLAAERLPGPLPRTGHRSRGETDHPSVSWWEQVQADKPRLR